jgi:hypothetical protein
MKALKSLSLLVIFISLMTSGCTKEEELTRGERNAALIKEILKSNTIKFVNIYEFDYASSKWALAADNQKYSSDMELCYVKGTFFYLDGTGSKTYGSTAPTHQFSGFYYFNLEYLVSFELDGNKEHLYLYFKY